jgi:hypothetical protein
LPLPDRHANDMTRCRGRWCPCRVPPPPTPRPIFGNDQNSVSNEKYRNGIQSLSLSLCRCNCWRHSNGDNMPWVQRGGSDYVCLSSCAVTDALFQAWLHAESDWMCCLQRGEGGQGSTAPSRFLHLGTTTAAPRSLCCMFTNDNFCCSSCKLRQTADLNRSHPPKLEFLNVSFHCYTRNRKQTVPCTWRRVVRYKFTDIFRATYCIHLQDPRVSKAINQQQHPQILKASNK